MRTDVLLTIKETLEKSKEITVLSLTVDDNIVFGVYISNVRNNLSFLKLPESHFETIIDDINIQFFELGTVLHNIYFNGALKFLDILVPDSDIMTPNSYYLDLCDFVLENLPFNIAKLNYIQAINQKFNYENDVEKVSMLMRVALELNTNLLVWYDGLCMDNFTYITEIENENEFIKACNAINTFGQWLQAQKFAKISEKNMNRIDEMYINIQILHMEV